MTTQIRLDRVAHHIDQLDTDIEELRKRFFGILGSSLLLCSLSYPLEKNSLFFAGAVGILLSIDLGSMVEKLKEMRDRTIQVNPEEIPRLAYNVRELLLTGKMTDRECLREIARETLVSKVVAEITQAFRS